MTEMKTAVGHDRRRGRPPGTGKDDVPTLAAMADLLVATPGLKPTTAMRRVVTRIGDSHLRRLQDKWRVHGARLLAEADRRRQEQAETAARDATARRSRPTSPAAAYDQTAGLMNRIPRDRNLARLVDFPAATALRDMLDSPMMRQIRQIQDSPMMRLSRHLDALRALGDPLGLRRR